MKFENPIMNVSMFDVENIVTESETAVNQAAADAKSVILSEKGIEATGNVLTFTF